MYNPRPLDGVRRRGRKVRLVQTLITCGSYGGLYRRGRSDNLTACHLNKYKKIDKEQKQTTYFNQTVDDSRPVVLLSGTGGFFVYTLPI